MFACTTADECVVVDGMGPCCCQNGGRNYAVNREAMARKSFCEFCGYLICATVYNCADYGATCREGRCELTYCGDGHVDDGEECDDGNWTSADGCGPGCARERCGRAASWKVAAAITSTDALYVLGAATGGWLCPACVCDVDGSGGVTAADALKILAAAIGARAADQCPPCDGAFTAE